MDVMFLLAAETRRRFAVRVMSSLWQRKHMEPIPGGPLEELLA